MKERPILFSGEMVRAILDGRKSQTRRVVQPPPDMRYGAILWSSPRYDNGDGVNYFHTSTLSPSIMERWAAACPFGVVGDRLWVRETAWYDREVVVYAGRRVFFEGGDVRFERTPETETVRAFGLPESHCAAVFDLSPQLVKRPSIFMPRWASRITLEIAGVRVERLKDISEDDAVAEGRPRHTKPPESISTVEMFATSWNHLNEKRGYGWNANPWVWVIEFKRVDQATAAPAAALDAADRVGARW